MCVLLSFDLTVWWIAEPLLCVCIRYDLKQGTPFVPELDSYLICITDSALISPEISKSPVSKVPVELAKHESAQHRVTRDMKRKRDADDQG